MSGTPSVRRLHRLGLAVVVASCAAGALVWAQGAERPAEVDILGASIADLQAWLTSGRLTSRDLVDLYLARIAAYDTQGPALTAIRIVNPRAREEADALDAERRSKGSRGPLHGIPIIVKDNYQTDGLPTSDGSVLFADFRPSPDATIVRRLREAGVVVLAKSNMHEFAYGIESYGSLFGQVRNPYNPERNAGGSSGGTGAAVAAGFAAAGLGSDTCGSIRIPAAHNNLVGLRPTMGVTSRYGIVPLATTQDIGGPITRSVADLALMLDAVAGFDPRDAATAESVGRVPASYTDYLRPDGLRGARLGVLAELFGSEARDQPVTAVVRAALGQASARGAAVVDVEVKDLAVLLKDASVVREEFPFDIERYLSQFPDAPYKTFQQILESGRWHPRLKERMTRSAAVRSSLSPEYLEKIKRRTTIRYAVLSVMAEQQLDALVYPTIRRVAAPLAEEQAGSTCALSAVTGLPAMVVPAGFDPDGLPVGVELLGAAFAEPKLISLGYALEQATRYRRLPSTTPPLAARQ